MGGGWTVRTSGSPRGTPPGSVQWWLQWALQWHYSGGYSGPYSESSKIHENMESLSGQKVPLSIRMWL